jgi:hypothetical protein
MMWEREAELRSKGISTKDIAAYSYAFHAVSAFSSVHLMLELICHLNSRRTFSKFPGFSFASLLNTLSPSRLVITFRLCF